MNAPREVLTVNDTEAGLCRIPVFRTVALELLKTLDDANTGVMEVAELVGSDPALSAEVLITANSAAYGSRRAANTVDKAIAVVGLDRTRAIALRAALDGMKRSLGNAPAVERAWQHSRATAVIAEWLAPYYRFHPDRAYMGGLLHDIGRLGLLSVDCERYAELLDKASGTNQELMAAERVVFKFDHCEAGLWLTRTWGLPEEFWNVCADHHEEEGSNKLPPQTEIAHMACGLAYTLGYAAAPHLQVTPSRDTLEQLPRQVLPRPSLPAASLWNRLKDEFGSEPIGEQFADPTGPVN